jgi:TonB family protein
MSHKAHARKDDPVEKGRTFLPALIVASAPVFALGLVASAPDSGAKEAHYDSISVRFATNDSKKTTDSLQTAENKGTAPEAGSSSEGARHVYLSEVIRRIEAAKRYPRREQAAGIEDRVTVKLRIRADGTVIECSLTDTSSYDGFNSEALASIRRAGPFPPFPPEFKESETILYVTLDFRLH